MAIWQWSKTAASNAGADPTINFAEGQSASSLNDSCRALMARVAEYRDDTAGMLADTGTASAYAVLTNEGLPSTPNDGTVVSITPAHSNANGVTFQADLGNSYPIQSSPGNGIGAGVMVAGTPYDLMFHAATPCWLLKNTQGTAVVGGVVPIGGLIDYLGSTSPSSNFVLPFGQQVSRATYATLFGIVGTTYGNGDGVTTFNVIDMRGRIGAGLDNMGGTAAGRLTSGGSGVVGTQLGANGGLETHTQAVSELPSHGHSTTVTDPGHVHACLGNTLAGSNPFFTLGNSSNNNSNNTQSATTGITVSANNTGGGNPFNITQPTIIVGKLLRVL